MKKYGDPQKNNCNNCNCNKRPFINHLKSYKSMKYDISKSTAPTMPNLGKGTECIKILLSQVSKDMYEPFVLLFFLILAHTSATQKKQYPDFIQGEICTLK